MTLSLQAMHDFIVVALAVGGAIFMGSLAVPMKAPAVSWSIEERQEGEQPERVREEMYNYDCNWLALGTTRPRASCGVPNL